MFTTLRTVTAPRRTPPLAADDLRGNPWLAWRPETPAEREVLTVAELAECRCPDICNRDHANE